MFIKDSIDIAKPIIKDDKAIENIGKAASIAQSIDLAFTFCKSGIRASKIDKEVEKYIKSQNGFEVSNYGFATSISIGNEIAHGVGYEYHEAPYIFNFYHPNNYIILDPNMVFAFELMIKNGSDKYSIEEDGWTISTNDSSLGVHFEHTVLITKDVFEILGIN